MNNDEIILKINEILDSLRIYINQDGGDVEFIKYEDQKVFIKVKGACVDCYAIDFTYKEGLETILQEEIPEIKEVVIVNNSEN